jgi:uncharacterized protein (DUF2141 family)
MIARALFLAGLALAPQTLRADPAADVAGGVNVTIVITGLRSTRGNILACLTARAETFPECEKDKQAQSLTVPARNGPVLVFRHVRPGAYAVSLFHDENGNGRMDKTFGIPREGYGFSRDAPVKMAPPRFAAAQFGVAGTDVTQTITVRYIL